MSLLTFIRHFFCVYALLASSNAWALDCAQGESMEHSFSSGATWNFCAVLDEHHALELQNIHYQAPGDSSRQVLQHLHLGQVLLHYHDRLSADVLISDNKLGGDALKSLNESLCGGTLHTFDFEQANICTYVRDTGLMAKYNLRPGLQGQQYRIYSVSQYQGLTFKVQIGLSEDGRIAPSVTLSGQASRTTNNSLYGNSLVNPLSNQTLISTQASVLYTWRMAFSLNDDEQNDAVEEFNFKLEPSLGSRRPMQVTQLSTETLRKKNRDQFRGWRVKDINGSGYYLDPQNSGFSFTDRKNNWAQFDLAITAFDTCERHSRIGDDRANVNNEYECGGSIDDFISGEPLSNRNPVLWYSMNRVFRPKAEDYPVISSMQVEFEIIPFDWTPTSPFEVVQ